MPKEIYQRKALENSICKESLTFLSLGVASSAYALVLNTEKGKKFAQEYTWASVVLGTSLVLACLRLIVPSAIWKKIALGFVIAGSPMIIRSLVNKIND